MAFLGKRHGPHLDPPITVDATFVYRTPKHGRASPGDPRPSKPDVDNLVKQVLDALEGHWWAQDAHVVDVRARKVYGEGDATIIMATGGTRE